MVVVDCMVWCDLVLMGIMVANNSVIEIMPGEKNRQKMAFAVRK